MVTAITWRSAGRRSNGSRCTITEVTQYDKAGWAAAAVPRGSYVLVDHEAAERLGKGRYRIVPRNEVVVCDHPEAP
jgi:hypothetical protein